MPSSQIPDISFYQQQVEEAVSFIREHLSEVPTLALVLGTGLGKLAKEINVETVLSYDELPHFPISTVESHDGRLLIGSLRGTSVLAMQGRFHLYEGYSPHEITFPIRVFGVLGVETLLISNAAGGMNPQYRCSDLMLISDHINLQGANPLIGPNVEAWGPRFPDMSAAYDPELQHLAREVALSHRIKLQRGVYVAVSGPNLETRAEYRLLRMLGADAVGMSTVPEVIVARHMGMRVMAISVITDECFPDALEPVTIENVLAAAAAAEPKLTVIMASIAEKIGQQLVSA